MDQSSLVADEVADGRRLLERFVADGNDVTAAAWITAEGSETSFLYIATSLYDSQGPRGAYHAAGASSDSIADSFTAVPDLRLVSPGNPITRAIVGLAKPGSTQVGFPMRAQQIGPLGEARLYIYNPWVFAATPPGSMTAEDVGRAVFRLLQRGTGPQPTSRVTLKDGTGFEGRPLALFAGDRDSMRVQFVAAPDLAVRDLKLGEIAAIR